MTDRILVLGSVGADVQWLQSRLSARGYPVLVDGDFGPKTEQAVKAFQSAMGLVIDGDAGPKTQYALRQWKNPLHLGEADLQAAAKRLEVSLAHVKAVNSVESQGEGFLRSGRVKVLFERHVMYRELKEAGTDPAPLQAKYPALINAKRGGYAGGESEHNRIRDAGDVSQQPAIAAESASYGLFQIMGYHWSVLKYPSIEAFVAAMAKDEASQLDAFVRFIEADPALLKALRAGKWAEFARLYNGPDYKANLYDVKLQRAFERFSPQPEKVPA